ncbi:MAG: T9SS type A sorting domain-containing protein [Sphingobacteriales bacterium]|nr:T9SS type A sorting domain-containing protein [Sphingobacteriales bacterium]
MNQRLRIAIICLFQLVLPVSLSAQVEVIRPLRSNTMLLQEGKTPTDNTVRRQSINSLVLPFTDDFSGTSPYADPNLWLDRGVYINSHLPKNMLTVGVATFDGLDANGQPYDNSFSTSQGSCDTLTSQPIQLNLNKRVSLSFMVQRKGNGDAPELSDSLVLEFYNPTDSLWSRQWFLKGGVSNGADTLFESYWLHIDSNSVFQQDGFRFRFRNHGARTGALDHWHLDYVRLYQSFDPSGGTVDSVWSDVAMTRPVSSLLQDYTAVPWEHFLSLSPTQQSDLLVDSAAMYYRVTSSLPADVGFNHRIYDFQGTQTSAIGATNGNIFPGRPNNAFLNYTFPITSTALPNSPALTSDSTYFTIRNYFSNGNAFPGLKSNDTVEFKQVFYNYYSFDDGSAEGGYDLIGTNTGKVAMRFDFLQPDTLRAVQFFFAQYGDTVTNLLFNLKVWSSISPETVLYQKPNQRAKYADSLNGFATYFLDAPLYVNGPIYIGFQQQQNFPSGIHLGFDKNTSSNSRMYYNAGSGWVNTTVANGSFMIRPVFGEPYGITSIGDQPEVTSPIALFPNPARDRVNFNIDSSLKPERIVLFDALGRIVFESEYINFIDCSSFESGHYHVSVILRNGERLSGKLFIVR